MSLHSTGLAALVIVWTKVYASIYGVDPYFALGVFNVESGVPGQEFRAGLMGKTYYGPAGIHRSFLTRWPIDDLKTNIEVGVAALRGKSPRAVLRRYNKEWNIEYEQAVLAAADRYRRELR